MTLSLAVTSAEQLGINERTWRIVQVWDGYPIGQLPEDRNNWTGNEGSSVQCHNDKRNVVSGLSCRCVVAALVPAHRRPRSPGSAFPAPVLAGRAVKLPRANGRDSPAVSAESITTLTGADSCWAVDLAVMPCGAGLRPWMTSKAVSRPLDNSTRHLFELQLLAILYLGSLPGIAYPDCGHPRNLSTIRSLRTRPT